MLQESSGKHIKLRPFSAENAPEECRIDAIISNDGPVLKVAFELNANLTNFIIPCFDPAHAIRKDSLWEHTCFEVFIALEGMPDYREFNLSPSGEWNVYSFSGYREGMKPERFFNTLPFEITFPTNQTLKLETAIDLNLLKDFLIIDVGLSAVLEHNDGIKSYWAVDHTKKNPDFHARESWLRIILTQETDLSIVSIEKEALN